MTRTKQIAIALFTATIFSQPAQAAAPTGEEQLLGVLEAFKPLPWPFQPSSERGNYHFREFSKKDFSEENRAKFQAAKDTYPIQKELLAKMKKSLKAQQHKNFTDFMMSVKNYDNAISGLSDEVKMIVYMQKMQTQFGTDKKTGKKVLLNRSGQLLKLSPAELEAEKNVILNYSVFLPADDANILELKERHELIAKASKNSKALLDVYKPKKVKVKRQAEVTKTLRAAIKNAGIKGKVIDISFTRHWSVLEYKESLVLTRYNHTVDGLFLVKRGGKYYSYSFGAVSNSYNDGRGVDRALVIIGRPTEIPKGSVAKPYRK